MTPEGSRFEARVLSVDAGSPAHRAGIRPGMRVLSVEGEPLRDLIDWRWMADDERISLEVRNFAGAVESFELSRDYGEDWGIEFDGIVFDGLRRCANQCTFCFIESLPAGVRPSLLVRDDDYRLSFLTGTFATLTNLSEADIERIVSWGLSPLRVSLHAVDEDVRRALMGPLQARGLQTIECLLAEGVEMHMQIVLVPGVNDGSVLEETLAWAEERPGVLSVGVVPVAYTRYSAIQRSFDDPEAAAAVIETIKPFQARAQRDPRGIWAFASDEFYLRAFGSTLLKHLPPDDFYGDFEMFEDGIGIIRTVVDEFRAVDESDAQALAAALERAGVPAAKLVVGEAMMPWFAQLIAESPVAGRLEPLAVRNEFFGGNVNVTGLLTGQDVISAIREDSCKTSHAVSAPYGLLSIMFNDDGFTLDDYDLEGIRTAVDAPVSMVSLTPKRYLLEFTAMLEHRSAQR